MMRQQHPKMTTEQKAKAWRLHKTGKFTMQMLADRFDVHMNTMQLLVSRMKKNEPK